MALRMKLAWRSIWRNKRRTLITLSSIALGLALTLFFVAVGDGVYFKMVEEAVRIQGGHLSLQHPDYLDAPAVDLLVDLDNLRTPIERLPGVGRTKTMVLGQGLVKSGSGAVGVGVMGVEPSREQGSSPLAKKVVAGGYLEDSDAQAIYIGKELARQLKLAVGKKLVLSANNVSGEVVEELLRVKGIFALGAPEVDGYLIQVPIGLARRLFGLGPGQASRLGVVVDDPDRLEEVRAAIQKLAAGKRMAVLRWEEFLPDLASWIQLDKGSNYVFNGLLGVVILFTIFNTILMSVLERQREFAVLLALGTPPRFLEGQILLETALVGALGSLLGALLGGGLAYWVEKVGIDTGRFIQEGTTVSGFVMDTVIHARVTGGLILTLGCAVFLMTMLLGLYPMRRVAKGPMAQWLR